MAYSVDRTALRTVGLVSLSVGATLALVFGTWLWLLPFAFLGAVFVVRRVPGEEEPT